MILFGKLLVGMGARGSNDMGLACLVIIASFVGLVLSSSEWQKFKDQHGKLYESALEERMRHSIFVKNKLDIERFNQDESSTAGFKLELNHLADWTREEYNRMLGFKLPSGIEVNRTNSAEAEKFLLKILGDRSAPLPETVDWRQVPGRVTRVKNQGHCGSCWAFSTTGVLEGQELNVTGRKNLVGLSEQNLVDCVIMEGCSGGLPMDALDYIHRKGGIMDETSYPYTAKDGKHCKFNKSDAIMTDSGFVMRKEGDEELLKEVVAKFGPVSVAIDATRQFQFYKEGVFQDSKCLSGYAYLDHAVLLVGYGTTQSGVDYWLVKNSWGADWGESGYFRIARNQDNMCGIASQAVIPTFA